MTLSFSSNEASLSTLFSLLSSVGVEQRVLCEGGTYLGRCRMRVPEAPGTWGRTNVPTKDQMSHITPY